MQLTPDSRFMIRNSFPGVGQGLFAVRSIEAGEFVIEYIGERLPTGTAEDGGSHFLFVVDDDWTLDGPVPGNIAGYINHACMPNCEARVESGRVNFYALRDIESGEELGIDYGEEYFNEFIAPYGCKCRLCINAPA